MSEHTRYRIDLSYDGRGFQGFALQPDGRTVVGLLRETLTSTLQLDELPFLTGAGRTDAGVMAYGQVVSVDLPAPFGGGADGVEKLRRAMNAQLSGEILLHAIREVRPDFDARYDALWRHYRYLVVEGDRRGLSLTKESAWLVDGPLDVALMNQAAALTVGEHDFGSFCKRPSHQEPGEPLRRRVLAATWSRVADPASLLPNGGHFLRLDIRGTSFCHNMVRSLTGAMVAIGQKKLEIEELGRRLEVPHRDHLPRPAPPSGLCLLGVGYSPLDGGPSGFLE